MAYDLFAPSPAVVEPRPMFPDQARALSALRAAVGEGERRIVLQAPTGFGKTRLSAEMVRGALAKGKRVIFTVPALSLVEQTVLAFEQEGIDAIGVLQGVHERTDRSQPVQVASVQTLERRAIPAADLVLIDECHRTFKFVNRWLDDPDWAQVPMIGLSATPWAKGMGKHWRKLIVAARTGELIEAGRLSPFRVYAPSHPDLSAVKTVAGEYHEGELSEVMSERKIVADVVETWKKLGTRNKTLCFAVDRAHAAKLQTEFTEAGVDCAYVDAFTTREEREDIRVRFHAGRVEVVVSIGTMIAGVDWDVRCLSIARPTKSDMLHVQMIGRALRTAPGKQFATILDHADNNLRLGLVTEIHRPRLDDGKPKSKQQQAQEKPTPLPKACSACGVLKPPKTPICPACGHKAEKQSAIEVEDGELVEFGAKSEAKTPKEKFDHAAKQVWLSMFRGYAHEKNKSASWVLAQYKSRFGVWPRGMDDSIAIPNAEVLTWITAQNIRWAKSKKRRAA